MCIDVDDLYKYQYINMYNGTPLKLGLVKYELNKCFCFFKHSFIFEPEKEHFFHIFPFSFGNLCM